MEAARTYLLDPRGQAERFAIHMVSGLTHKRPLWEPNGAYGRVHTRKRFNRGGQHTA